MELVGSLKFFSVANMNLIIASTVLRNTNNLENAISVSKIRIRHRIKKYNHKNKGKNNKARKKKKGK